MTDPIEEALDGLFNQAFFLGKTTDKPLSEHPGLKNKAIHDTEKLIHQHYEKKMLGWVGEDMEPIDTDYQMDCVECDIYNKTKQEIRAKIKEE
jgi:hypothetical protein